MPIVHDSRTPLASRMDRRALLRAALGIGAACLARGAAACEFPTTSLTVVHPWTRASAPGADTAIVSLRFQDIVRTDRLIAASTPVARAVELAGQGFGPAIDFLIVRGEELEFSESGVHLRLVGLLAPLEVGREYPFALEFAAAGRVAAALSVDFAAA